MIREISIASALVAVSFLAFVRADLKVTQVQVLFRHGDRTPTINDVYPNDIHKRAEYEPWGLGQLTNTGKMRAYRVGKVLKSRYEELLGPLYIPNSVYATSTDFDRTKMSLQLVLAGLFTPSKLQMWNSDLPWMPIPIHSVPEPLDTTMKGELCPEYIEEVDRTLQLPEVQARVAQHIGLFRYLSMKTGLNITKPLQVYDIHNLLIAQKGLNLKWPEWCTSDVFRHIREVTVLQFKLWSYTTEAKRIGGGPMVRKFIENMFINRTEENPRKMYLYSAHDTTVAAYLRAQGIDEPELPDYSTAVMIEKLEDDYGKLYVRIVLWSGVTEKLITLRVPGCDEVCPIETYLQLTREVIPSDDEVNCLWRHMRLDKLLHIFDEEINEH